MLVEIRSSVLIEEVIRFHEGLNPVLGDNYSTNSIGKSTFLMLIDFVFGGDSYITKNSGSIKIIGDHEFQFQFKFGAELKYFRRSTESSDTVSVCDSNYQILNEVSLSKFTASLRENYDLPTAISFRSAVSLYSRIWGKDNYNVDKPLKSFSSEKEIQSVNNIVKLFNRFDKIVETLDKIKGQEEAKKVLSGLHKKNFVEKLSKTAFQQNKEKIELINSQISEIKENLLQYTLNIEELSNKEVMALKIEKSRLLRTQDSLLNKIKRIEVNLDQQNLKSKHLKRLSTFFDSVNEGKIQEIESFHNKISGILRRELLGAKKILDEQNKKVIEQIDVLDGKISLLLQNVDSPKFIVEKIYDLTIEANKLVSVNKFYEQRIEIDDDLAQLNEKLSTVIDEILYTIETLVNTELIDINNRIHSPGRKIPRLRLSRKAYSYDHSDNTGTGKSFADLIEFDLAILKLTNLPILIHDSILFKNIEDVAVDKILRLYSGSTKQIFIALDAVSRYSQDSQTILNSSAVLNLNETRKLFNKDWR